MPLIDRFYPFRLLAKCFKIQDDIIMQGTLIFFQPYHVVSSFVAYLLDYFLLAAHGVSRHDRPVYVYQFKKLRYRRYFVCFFRDGYFTKCDLIFSDKCTHHMIRHMFGIAAAAYGFSVNGYYRALFTFNIKPI